MSTSQFAGQAPPRMGTEAMLSLITQRVRMSDDPAEQICSLITYAMEHYRSYPLYAKAAAEEALRLVISSGDKILICHALYALSLGCHALGQYSEALHHLFQMLNTAGFLRDEKLVADAQYEIGVNYERLGEYPRALQYLFQALNSYYDLEALPELRRSYHAVGWVIEGTGNLQRALKFHKAGLEISRIEDIPSAMAESHHNIAIVFGAMGEFDKALDHFADCRQLRRITGDGFGEAVAAERIGSMLQKQGNLREALFCYGEALELFASFDNLSMAAHTQSKIGMLLFEAGNYTEALEYLHNARNLSVSLGKTSMAGGLLYGIAACLNATNEFHRAYEYALLALDEAEAHNNLNLQHQVHLLCSEVWNNLGDIARSFEHFRSFHAIKELAHSAEKERLMAEMQTRFETEQLHKEKEDYRIRAEKLAEDVESKNREITMLALHLTQKNEAIGKIHKKVSKLHSETEESSRSELHEIAGDMRSTLNSEHAWKMFEARLSMMNPDFIKRLSQMYKQLTPTELKICALLKMNLANKEIADMLCVSLHNIEMHRYRIRKKLHLSTQDNLATFLAPI